MPTLALLRFQILDCGVLCHCVDLDVVVGGSS